MIIKIISFSLFFIVTLTLLLVNSLVSHKSKMHRNLLSSFECGFDSFSNARISFSLHFFLITIIFLVFDLEIIFLLPLPFFTKFSSITAFSMMAIIPFILFAGTVHEWNEGSLNWF